MTLFAVLGLRPWYLEFAVLLIVGLGLAGRILNRRYSGRMTQYANNTKVWGLLTLLLFVAFGFIDVFDADTSFWVFVSLPAFVASLLLGWLLQAALVVAYASVRHVEQAGPGQSVT